MPNLDTAGPTAGNSAVALAAHDPGLGLGDDLVDDPGIDGGESRQSRQLHPNGQMNREEKRAAVDTIIALMGTTAGNASKGAPADGTAPAAPAVLPTARTRNALYLVASFGTVEALEAAQIDVKSLCRDLFDWDNPSQTRATKTVVKAAAAALLGRRDDGSSVYPAAVEMLSFAAAAAPLLEPDRLARLIATAPDVQTAFKPEMYTMQLAAALRTLLVGRHPVDSKLARYQPARREQLLISLWVQAHDGRWWDMTSGVLAVRTGHTNARDEEEKKRRLDAETAVREVLAGAAEGTKKAHQVIGTALVNGDLAYSEAAARRVAALPSNEKLARNLGARFERLAAGDAIDPDIALLASHLRWLAPDQRPETPLTWLLKTLIVAITPDPETGEAAVDKLPDRPRTFSDLFPLAEFMEFPYPNSVRRLHQTVLPGTDRDPVLIDLIVSPMELARNRDRMNNCTWGYKDRLERGDAVLLALWRGRDCYNASLHRNPGGWGLTEINSVNNRGNVPADITAGVQALTRALPDPGPKPELIERRHRKVRYSIQ